MATDLDLPPDLFWRLSSFPLIRNGRFTLHRRRGGYSLFDATLNQPIVRIRPTGSGDRVALLYPDPRGGWMPPAALGDGPMSLDKALHAIEPAIAFLDHMADAAHARTPKLRSPL